MPSSNRGTSPTHAPNTQTAGPLSGDIAPQNVVQSTFDTLLEAGELLEADEFLQRLGSTPEALGAAVAAHRLFRIEVSGVSAYPAFYLDGRYNRSDLENVIEALGDLSGGSKWLFFTKPKASLSAPLDGSPTARARAGEAVTWPVPTEGVYIGPVGVRRTPLQALEGGEVARVRKAAAAYAQR